MQTNRNSWFVRFFSSSSNVVWICVNLNLFMVTASSSTRSSSCLCHFDCSTNILYRGIMILIVYLFICLYFFFWVSNFMNGSCVLFLMFFLEFSFSHSLYCLTHFYFDFVSVERKNREHCYRWACREHGRE